MDYFVAVFLGILQGITEFFPISSSGHLLLAEHFLDLPVEHLKAFDVVLHAGTLLALLALFWRDWLSVIRGFFVKNETAGRRLFGMLVVATIPAAVAGLLLGDQIDAATRGENLTIIVASLFLIVAALLALAEWRHKNTRNKKHVVGWRQVVAMAVFQACALLPGVSRSGSTIAAGMLFGLDRATAARFSFLMLAPATAGAVLLIGWQVWAGELTLPATEFVVTGFAVSALVSYAAAAALLAFVKKYSLAWFAGYLILAAAVLFYLN